MTFHPIKLEVGEECGVNPRCLTGGLVVGVPFTEMGTGVGVGGAVRSVMQSSR